MINTKTPASIEAPEEEGLFWIENAGEYEIGGVRIEGWNAGHEKESMISAYRITIEEIEVGVIGPIATNPSSEVIEGLGEVDILILPAGGGTLLDVEDAVKLARQIEPGIVIPYDKGEPKRFFAELGQAPKPEEKLVIKKKEITPGKIQGVWLKA